jgi:type IV pilus assembly protein PilQ
MKRCEFNKRGLAPRSRRVRAMSVICMAAISAERDASAAAAAVRPIAVVMAEHDVRRLRAPALDAVGPFAQPESREIEGAPTPLPPPSRLDSTAPAKRDAAHNAGLPAGEPISLTFRDAELSVVLAAFAEFTGLNIIVSDKVCKTVSLRLVDVPWRRAFDTLLDAHGLAMEQRGSVIWVAPGAEIAERERLRESRVRAALSAGGRRAQDARWFRQPAAAVQTGCRER